MISQIVREFRYPGVLPVFGQIAVEPSGCDFDIVSYVSRRKREELGSPAQSWSCVCDWRKGLRDGRSVSAGIVADPRSQSLSISCEFHASLLDICLDFRCSPTPRFDYALHFNIVARQTTRTASARFPRRAARIEIRLERGIARKARRVRL